MLNIPGLALHIRKMDTASLWRLLLIIVNQFFRDFLPDLAFLDKLNFLLSLNFSCLRIWSMSALLETDHLARWPLLSFLASGAPLERVSTMVADVGLGLYDTSACMKAKCEL